VDNITILDKDGQLIFTKNDVITIGTYYSEHASWRSGFEKHTFRFESEVEFPGINILEDHYSNGYPINIKSGDQELINTTIHGFSYGFFYSNPESTKIYRLMIII